MIGFFKASVGTLALMAASAALAQNAPTAAAETKGETTVGDDVAPSQAPNGDEIIVTAQKRAENVQDVPISISAFSGAMLERSNVVTVFDLPRIAPSLQLDTGLQASKARIVIRGIGSAGGTAVEPSVATFLDGIYIPREGATVGAYLDLAAIEVLRGPQGTLFGRNASVGAISLRSAQPDDEFSARIAAEGATGDRYRMEGYVNIPVSAVAAFRVAAVGEKFDGYYKNRLDGRTVGGSDSFAGRISGKFDVTPDLKVILRANYSTRDGDSFANYALLPDTFPAGRQSVYLARLATIGSTDVDLDPFDRTINQYVGDDLHDENWGLSSDITLDTASGFSLRLLNGFQDWNNDQIGTGAFSATVPTLTQFVGWGSRSHSHELQVVSPQDRLLGGRLDFVAGVYYLNEEYTAYEAFQFNEGMCRLVFVNLAAPVFNSCLASSGGRAFDQNFRQETNSFAVYGQTTFKIAPTLDFVLGGRWTQDKKTARIVQMVPTLIGTLAAAAENTALNIKDDRFTWRANLNWRPNDDVLLFTSYSTGYKSGGFNSQTSPTVLGQNRIFNPETVSSYELGVKTDWLNRTLQVNATVYRMAVKNFQDRSYNGINFSLQNAGDIRNQGVEIDIVARPVKGLRFNTSVSFLDAKFTNYPGASNLPGLAGTRDITGARPTFTPKWSGSIGAEYERELGSKGLAVLARGDLAFVSDNNVGLINDDNPQTTQEAYQLASARLTLFGPERKWSIGLFGSNLFDKGYCTSLAYQPFGGLIGAVANGRSALRCNTVGTPRTVGVSGSVRF
jgi:iron complex outermembrane receptor protein